MDTRDDRDDRSHADGYPQPIAVAELRTGDWACPLWHGWPASALAHARNIAGQAPSCPVCRYPLWRVRLVEEPEGQGMRVEFDERDDAE